MTTLETAYTEAHIRLAAAIKALQEDIHDMPAPEGDTPYDWGHVGTVCMMAAVVESLVRQ